MAPIQDQVITDVTEPWGLCTGDDGDVFDVRVSTMFFFVIRMGG